MNIQMHENENAPPDKKTSLLPISKRESPNTSESAAGMFTNVPTIQSTQRRNTRCVCLRESQQSFLLQVSFLYKVLRESESCACVCMFFLSVCVCFGLCVFLWAVAVSSSTLERELTSFCQPLPVSICCCLLSTGCRPSLSVKGNAVASNPSREPLFDAHWQEPGSGYSGFFHVCLRMCVRYCLETFACTRAQTTQMPGCFQEQWPLFTSSSLPSCSLFELQCTKRKQDAKVILHRHKRGC